MSFQLGTKATDSVPSAVPLEHTIAPAETPIRVTIVQPALAKYRVAVFRELARRSGIDLRVIYGAVAGLPNVVADGFEAIPSPRWQGTIAGNLLMFHGSEWKHCSRRHSDVVVLRWTPRSVTLLPALIRARANGVAAVLWGHGYSKNLHGRRDSARKRIAKRASSLVFYDPDTRDQYVRDGWNPDKLFVALNSLEHTGIVEARQWWQDRPDLLVAFRKEHGIQMGPVVLFVSRLQPANRVDLLVRATALLAQEIPDLKTVIIGNGPAEKERLETLAAEVGAARSIIFQEGVYDELKLTPWLLSADVFCYPENVGLSLIHAFWNGLPVVTSDNLGIQNPEVVALEHGTNGLTYEHGSVASLVDALRQIVTNEALRKSMSQAARRTVEERFTIPRMVDGLEAAIRYANRVVVTANHKNR
jgi:glycosyltransferase involved in cell wall biosynthesis